MNRLPDTDALIMGVVITVLAVVVWLLAALVQGNSINGVETVMFAVVFAFIYFSGIYLLGSGSTAADENSP